MIPIWIFFLIWLVLMSIYALMALISVTQMLRYGIASTVTAFTTFSFLACITIATGITGLYLIGVDWSQSVNVFGSLISSTIFSPNP